MMKFKSKHVLLGIAFSFTCLFSGKGRAQSVTYITIPVRTVDYQAAHIACQDDPNRPGHFRGSGCPGNLVGFTNYPAGITYSSPRTTYVHSEHRVWVPGTCSPSPPVYSLVIPQYKTYNITQKIQNNQYNVLQKNYHNTTTVYGNAIRR